MTGVVQVAEGGRRAAPHLDDRRPSLPPPGLASSDPILCTGSRRITLRNRFIHTAGDAIKVHGNCRVEIVDSHVVATGIGILATGNAEIEVVDSFVQGSDLAVQASGSAAVRYRGSTLRGGHQATGQAAFVDGGGSVLEPVPRGPFQPLVTGHATGCGDDEELAIVGQLVVVDGAALRAEGRCRLFISDSHLVAGDVAVEVSGEAQVTIRNSLLEGPEALRVSGEGVVSVSGTTFDGAIEAFGPAVRYHEVGGNTRR